MIPLAGGTAGAKSALSAVNALSGKGPPSVCCGRVRGLVGWGRGDVMLVGLAVGP